MPEARFLGFSGFLSPRSPLGFFRNQDKPPDNRIFRPYPSSQSYVSASGPYFFYIFAPNYLVNTIF